jgi:hypothetical protein
MQPNAVVGEGDVGNVGISEGHVASRTVVSGFLPESFAGFNSTGFAVVALEAPVAVEGNDVRRLLASMRIVATHTGERRRLLVAGTLS